MGFDKKIMDLSRTIYQTSVMSYIAKKDPSDQIDKIRSMIREFIRPEVVPYELTNQEKLSFILKNFDVKDNLELYEKIIKNEKDLIEKQNDCMNLQALKSDIRKKRKNRL